MCERDTSERYTAGVIPNEEHTLPDMCHLACAFLSKVGRMDEAAATGNTAYTCKLLAEAVIILNSMRTLVASLEDASMAASLGRMVDRYTDMLNVTVSYY